ncbi:MAG TPA: FAD-linked oxidase C-terminal domain-containing protein [Solirubrobacteraceae bacterium]|nr:FAD-linked oxidase C-terminal domain-containing protein [Solirubrobacteraceae bacterium]
MTDRPVLRRADPETVEAARQALSDLLGADRVHTGADDLAQHGHDESFHPEAPPDMVVWPRSVDEAAAIVGVAAAHRLPVVPFGAGTSLEGHVAALAGGLSIDMRDLDAIGRPSIEDLDVVVQAGVTRRALDAHLRPEGVFFSVDPGADATIGGMIATGASGTTTVRYGAMRENVLAITFIDARGQVVRTHSRARKSSAGYDLTRLMIGSEGTLGLICEATLRLHPTPEAIAAAQCTFPSVDAAVRCVVMVGQHAIPVARIELADELQIEAINRHNQTAFTVAPTLFLEFHGGSAAEVETQARDTAQLAAECGGSGFAWASDEAERRRLWHARHGAMEATRAMRSGSGALTTDVCVPVSALADCIAAAQADIAQHGLTASIVGHVGDGNFHVVVLVDPADPAEVARGEEFHARLVRHALEREGTCTGEHGVGYGKARFLVQEHGRPAVEMMRAIKRALDPDGIFNPGKIVATAPL